MQSLATSALTSDHRAATRVLVVGEMTSACPGSDELVTRGYELRRVRLAAVRRDGWADVVVLSGYGADPREALEFCRRNRAWGGPPLIVLHAHRDFDRSIEALEAGADDSLVAPHNPREVVARVRALLRRRSLQRTRPATQVRLEGLSLDLLQRRAETSKGHVDLTENQARLLAALLAKPGQVVDRQTLLDAILGPNGEAFDRAVDVQVCRLKKKLARISPNELIGAYRGVGYRINVRDAA